MHSQERLTEVGLDPICLMVDIVIVRIVGEEQLQWIPPDLVPAVIIDGLDRRKGEQEDILPGGQFSKLVRQTSTEGIEK